VGWRTVTSSPSYIHIMHCVSIAHGTGFLVAQNGLRNCTVFFFYEQRNNRNQCTYFCDAAWQLKHSKLKLFLWLTKHHAMKTYWGVEVQIHAFFALDGGEWSASRPGRFIARVIAFHTHWIGGCVGPSAGLDTILGEEYKKFWEEAFLSTKLTKERVSLIKMYRPWKWLTGTQSFEII
jgi:hypothetical protein